MLTPALRAKILAATRKKPSHGSNHWTCCKLAAALRVSKDAVHRAWKEAGLKPHRPERYMASDDPDFEANAADIIGLYLNRPQHTARCSASMKRPRFRRAGRLDPPLPLSPGRAERHGFEYYRHGTLSLYAALNTKTGNVLGKTAAPQPHTPVNSSSIFSGKSSRNAARSSGSTSFSTISWLTRRKRSATFLAAHPRVHLYFTTSPQPTPLVAQSSRDLVRQDRTRWDPTGISLPCPTWTANSAVISTLIRPTRARSNGNTQTRIAAFAVTFSSTRH